LPIRNPVKLLLIHWATLEDEKSIRAWQFS